MRPTFILFILIRGKNWVGSFSLNDCSIFCYHRPCSRVPRNPSIKLCAGKNEDDSKIDWNPESNPKIRQLPSYSDNWLLNFHNWDQSEKQLVTNSLAAWNKEILNEQATIIEWQDSFQRNDLADFTPPMSNGLNCLMVGEDFDVVENNNDGSRVVKLPWEEQSEAQITLLRVLEESVVGTLKDDIVTEIEDYGIAATAEIKNDDDHDDDENQLGVSLAASPILERSMGGTNGGMVRTELVSHASMFKSSSAICVQDPDKKAATYDCIVDKGLMDRILALENSHETVRELLEEAAIAIKDLGIYVLLTKDLTEDSRKILEDFGRKTGLEWQFELDGISDGNQVVSVARRFCTGEMPKVGRLSRFQPKTNKQ